MISLHRSRAFTKHDSPQIHPGRQPPEHRLDRIRAPVCDLAHALIPLLELEPRAIRADLYELGQSWYDPRFFGGPLDEPLGQDDIGHVRVQIDCPGGVVPRSSERARTSCDINVHISLTRNCFIRPTADSSLRFRSSGASSARTILPFAWYTPYVLTSSVMIPVEPFHAVRAPSFPRFAMVTFSNLEHISLFIHFPLDIILRLTMPSRSHTNSLSRLGPLHRRTMRSRFSRRTEYLARKRKNTRKSSHWHMKR